MVQDDIDKPDGEFLCLSGTSSAERQYLWYKNSLQTFFIGDTVLLSSHCREKEIGEGISKVKVVMKISMMIRRSKLKNNDC